VTLRRSRGTRYAEAEPDPKRQVAGSTGSDYFIVIRTG
jgi:hypothetical protein